VKKIFVIAGEASGDLHGANLIKALKTKEPGLQIFGAGGDLMHAQCNEDFIPTAHFNATGFTEIIRHLGDYWRLFNQIIAKVDQVKPELIVTIDNPGFNLRLAKKIRSRNIPMIYYISPQIWAWAANRIHLIKKCFRKALVVFNFECDIYIKNQMPVAWVGHPLNDVLGNRSGKPNSGPKKKVILMPGSRINEVKRLLPILLETASLIQKNMDVEFTLIQAPTIPQEIYTPFLKKGFPVTSVRDHRHQHMSEAALALVCSGTATLECTLFTLPMIVVYRSSFMTHLLACALVKVDYLSIPNLLAKKEIVPEFLQYNCKAANIASSAIELLKDEGQNRRMREDLIEVSAKTGTPGASARAAEEILKELEMTLTKE
jgi:lipid-A-disaccharide synthase